MYPDYIQPNCISTFIIYSKNGEHRYLLIRRCSSYLTGTWQMVTGGIQEPETAVQAALREIFEETGLVPSKFYSADAVEIFYLKTKDKIAFVPVFLAFVDELNSVTLCPLEHDGYEWLSFEEAKERLVWSEQKRIIQHVHENFVLKEPLEIHRIDI